MTPLLLMLIALAGAGVAAYGVVQARRQPALDAAEYLRRLDDDSYETDEFTQRLAMPFMLRVVRPFGSRVISLVGKFLPSNYLEQVHDKLLHAGLSSQIRAEEFVTGQGVFLATLTLVAVGFTALGHPTARMALLILVLLPLIGAMLPPAWLNRKVAERKLSIFKDLPDVLDLLAISVEAGLGFEGAMEIVCTHFNSPLAQELGRTLKEMELGLPRREALQNLKRRTEVPELSNFVLAMTQADALGMPIGRVLKTQGAEMRSKRRAWAREKAGKLPVKILFPLVFFLFPPILIVLLGPAFPSLMKAFGGG
jgi:tight adherence protein C